MNSLRVSHLLLSLNLGGLERLVADLVRTGVQLGQRVNVICLEQRGSLADLIEADAEVACLKKPPGHTLSTILRMRSLLLHYRPDIVHSHQLGPLFFGAFAAIGLRGVRVVHTQHGRLPLTHRRAGLLRRIAAPRAARFFCVSRDVLEHVRTIGLVKDSKLVVMPNGVDLQPFIRIDSSSETKRSLGIPEDSPVIGTVGRLAAIKRQDILLRVFAGLRGIYANVHLIIVGDGPVRSQLEDLARQLDVAHVTHFVGPQLQVAKFLQAMDVFLLTSESEGMPIAVLEACAAQRPVVASRVGGVPDVIQDGQNGLLCDFGDEQAHINAVCRLLQEPSRARRIAYQAQQDICRQYDIRRVVEAYQHHYLSLLQNRPVTTLS